MKYFILYGKIKKKYIKVYNMFEKINSIGLMGLNAFCVDVEIEVSKGIPSFDIVGLGDMVVRESRERIKAALRSSGIAMPVQKITINLAPADTKKTGSVTDLAIAVALLKVWQCVKCDLSDSAFIGEVSLSGSIRDINGVLPMAILAKEKNIKNLFVPKNNAFEASVVEGINVFGVDTLEELICHLNGTKLIEKQDKYDYSFKNNEYDLDFADVKGQQYAKKALEIAACGGHNALLIGSPGSGKSMLAKRMPSILPRMTFQEAVEATKIHSICGLIDKKHPLITERPFRSPHHTISSAGLVGGGSIPRPGEISLAHNGLLFLDELPEFQRTTLELLRQPLEDGQVTIARAMATVCYPCSIMVIGAMNPCPCGYFGHPTRKCTCSSRQVAAYLSKISGPMLDRFDLHVEVAPVEFEYISSKEKSECSAVIRERVEKAREIQNKRYKGTSITCNAKITSDILHEVCPMTPEAVEVMKVVFDKMGLSARAYDRILKVSRTIADMDGSEIIDKKHINQAVQYRSLDRKYWNN